VSDYFNIKNRLGWKEANILAYYKKYGLGREKVLLEWDLKVQLSSNLSLKIWPQGPNGPNKLECCITLGWKGLPVTCTLAY
jgi:hypothetical protein